jgi:hypothetical protein
MELTLIDEIFSKLGDAFYNYKNEEIFLERNSWKYSIDYLKGHWFDGCLSSFIV